MSPPRDCYGYGGSGRRGIIEYGRCGGTGQLVGEPRAHVERRGELRLPGPAQPVARSASRPSGPVAGDGLRPGESKPRRPRSSSPRRSCLQPPSSCSSRPTTRAFATLMGANRRSRVRLRLGGAAVNGPRPCYGCTGVGGAACSIAGCAAAWGSSSAPPGPRARQSAPGRDSSDRRPAGREAEAPTDDHGSAPALDPAPGGSLTWPARAATGQPRIG